MTNDRVLCVDDDHDQCTLLAAALERLGYAVDSCSTAQEALERVSQQRYSAVLTDLAMGDVSGFDLCEQLVRIAPNVPVVVVTGLETMEAVVGAMRAGAFDYLRKPVAANLLGLAVARAAQRGRLLHEIGRLRDSAETSPDETGGLLGDSLAMRKVREMIERVAGTDATVLIQGETGTGKELVARAIHRASSRSEGPFVAINCAAVPASLLESELFGHAKGAFTDAKSQRDGLFVAASGGTLFLDEIGEMPLEVQAKVLRALQERLVRPVGSNTDVPFNARILSATHRNLEQEITAERFRQDLYYRINVVNLSVPPLRERTEDILPLATRFLQRFDARADRPSVRLSSEVAKLLVSYDWPGNVRELENCMERVSALARFEEASPDDLPAQVRGYAQQGASRGIHSIEEIVTLDELERRQIMRVLKLVQGNKSRAAQLLGLDRRTLYRKLDREAARAEGRAVPEEPNEAPDSEPEAHSDTTIAPPAQDSQIALSA
jgi:two-component system response regulator HydG